MTTAVHTTWNSCFCECHSVIPVFIRDRVAAATACSKCRNDHVQKYGHNPHDRPSAPRPADACGDTGEGSE